MARRSLLVTVSAEPHFGQGTRGAEAPQELQPFAVNLTGLEQFAHGACARRQSTEETAAVGIVASDGTAALHEAQNRTPGFSGLPHAEQRTA